MFQYPASAYDLMAITSAAAIVATRSAAGVAAAVLLHPAPVVAVAS